MPTAQPTVIQWGLSSYSGWGVNGLQLALSWTRSGRLVPVCSLPLRLEDIALSPLEWRRMAGFVRESEALCRQIAPHAGQEIGVSVPVLRGLGNNLVGSRSVEGVTVKGQPTVGVCYLEDSAIDAEGRARAEHCAAIVAGSSFVERVLTGAGIGRVRTVLQGVDPTHFHPAPKIGWFKDRFVVFSGGKPEFRKGQDLALLGFRAFAKRHPEALLLTAWHNPWPESARSLEANPAVAPVPFHDNGQFDGAGWAVANGVPPDQVMDLGPVPNADMARILREVDVGLFPNRGEGGTNLVAMECMACGIPAILSANTGHLDLIGADRCVPLTRQGTIRTNFGADGWGESDVDEIVAALEGLWADRARAAAIGRAGAAFLAGLTWDRYADGVADVVKSVM
ncbi:glycosyl transferase family 1 [Azospirillum brasilense]|uniref:Glycosyl transferase family 1 n=1 Tax=Azospirillum brasilense TaxID=192 RepID=A0A560C136_AZOBR|nr:glycosyltransferase [Azospirillum brasilense]TWA78578.1 glycosyl transferase family 1 [Azospirillum brasilense]